MSDYFIIYGDDALSVYDSRQELDPNQRDVQIIVQTHPDVGWHTQSGYDYYVKWDDRWVGVDLFGLFDFLLEQGQVLFGRTTTQAEFNRAMKKALSIRDVEREKSGWLAQERQPNG